MNIFISGIRKIFRTKKLILIFYLLNLFSALIVALPLRSMLDNFAGHSLSGKALAEQFDISVILEMMSKNSAAQPVMMMLIIIAGLIYWFSHLFFSGGAYGLFTRDERYSAGEFWGVSALFFGRFIRLFLWSIPVFAICYSIQFLETAFVRVVFGKDPYQDIIFWGAWVRVGLGYIGILLYLLAFDYARIYAVDTDERRMRHALRYGIVFVFRHFFRSFAITFTIFLAEILILVLYNISANALLAPNAIIVLFLFLLQQVYIVARVKLRLMLYATQSSFYIQSTPESLIEPNTPGEMIDPNPLLII